MGRTAGRWTRWAAAAALVAGMTGVIGAAAPSAAQTEPTPTTTTPPTTAPSTTAPPTTVTPTTVTPTTTPAPTAPPTAPPPAPATTIPTAVAGTGPTAPTPAAAAAAAAAAADQMLTVTPATGLVDGAEVTVTVAGASAGEYAYVTQCLVGQASYETCDYYGNTYMPLDRAGNGTTTHRVSALLSTGYGEAEQETNCRQPDSCVLALFIEGEMGNTALAQAPLAFDPDGELVPPPVLTVTPATQLADRQVVTASGSGLVWSDYAVVLQCAADAQDSADCDYGTETYLDAGSTPAFSAQVTVLAVIETGRGEEIDCRVPGTCVLAVAQDGLRSRNKYALVALTFDPATEVVPPTVTISPATDLVDGQLVTVRGTGFVPGYPTIHLCAAAMGPGDCVESGSYAEVTPTGTFAAQVEVQAIITTAAGEVDCRTSAEPCLVVVASGSPTSMRAGRAELHLRPDGPVRPAPTITLDPDDDLPEVATVTVVGENFASSNWDDVSVEVCQVGNSGACDDQTSAYLAPDNDGRFTTDLGVGATFSSWSGDTVDCRVAPGCEVIARLGWQGRRASAPLGFAPATTPRDRYLDPVFDSVDVTRDVVYRETTDAAGNAVDLTLDIYEPAGDTEEQRPVVVWLHGGWFSPGEGDKADMAGYAEEFARRGYVAVSMDYRARPGLECCPSDDIEGILAAVTDAHDDAAAGVRWLRDHADDYGIDPDAIVAGGVEGGAATSYTLAHRPRQIERSGSSLVAAALPIAGVDLGWSESGSAAVMAFQGGDDARAPLHLAELSCARAARRGATCEAVGYGGVGYDVAGSRRRDIVHRATGFLAENVLASHGYVDEAGAGASPGWPNLALRDLLPSTGADLAHLSALALALAAVGGSLTAARRRQLVLGAEAGSMRLAGAAALTAVALVAGGFVVTRNLSPSSSGDDRDEAAEDVDHGAMDHGDDADDEDHADHDSMNHAAADHDGAGHDAGGAGHEGTHAADHDDHADTGGDDHAHSDDAAPGHGHAGGTADPSHPHVPGDPDPQHPHEPGDPDPQHPHEPEPEPPGNGFDPDWTPQQVAYAQGLIDQTEAQLVRYGNPALLPLLGYQWISDGKVVGEYQHWIHLSRIVDQRTLDPAYPESLVFRNSANGPVLEAAMYMLGLGYNLSNIPADIAWLPDWHVHENLCFAGNFELVGVTVNGRCERGNVVVTPPMIHVWNFDTRCGRFAGVDENGLICDHEH